MSMGYEVIQGNASHPLDVTEFIAILNSLDAHPELRTFFDSNSDVTVARAPGRLDVMGGIADYSGSVVLELPIAEATFVALQKDNSRNLRINSLLEDPARMLTFAMPLEQIGANLRMAAFQFMIGGFANVA